MPKSMLVNYVLVNIPSTESARDRYPRIRVIHLADNFPPMETTDDDHTTGRNFRKDENGCCGPLAQIGFQEMRVVAAGRKKHRHTIFSWPP